MKSKQYLFSETMLSSALRNIQSVATNLISRNVPSSEHLQLISKHQILQQQYNILHTNYQTLNQIKYIPFKNDFLTLINKYKTLTNDQSLQNKYYSLKKESKQ